MPGHPGGRDSFDELLALIARGLLAFSVRAIGFGYVGADLPDCARDVRSLGEFMIEGTTLNQAKLTENIDRSVIMVTALSPVIGYDKTFIYELVPGSRVPTEHGQCAYARLWW